MEKKVKWIPITEEVIEEKPRDELLVDLDISRQIVQHINGDTPLKLWHERRIEYIQHLLRSEINGEA